MKRFAEIVIKFRLLIIIICLSLTGILGYFIKDITMDTDFINYLCVKDTDVKFFKEIGAEFGTNYICMIAIETEDIFNYGTLSRIREMTRTLEKVEGIGSVMSITNILDIGKTEEGFLEVGNLIDRNRIPSEINELKRLREYTLSKDMYTNNLVSEDGKITVIVVRIKEDTQRDALAEEIRKIVHAMNLKEKVYFAGFPMVMNYMGMSIRKDMSHLIPIVVIVIIVTLFLSFRSFKGVILPLLTVGISTVWTLGLMAITNTPLTMLSAIMPVVLIATGTAYGIHLLNKYNHEVNSEANKKSQICEALSEIGIPIMLAAVTTCIGFLSLLSSTMSLFRDFGLFTAIGIAMALICSVTFLPAMLSYLPVSKKMKGNPIEKKDILDRIMGSFGKIVFKNKKPILIGVAIVTGIFILGIPHIDREVNFLSYFKEGSEPRVAEDLIKENFGGSTPFSISIRGDVKNPFILKEIELLEKWLKTVPNIRHPQSIAGLIIEMNDVMNDRRRIPSTEAGVGNLWFFLEGQDILEQMINRTEDEAIIQGKVNEIDTGVNARTVNAMNEILKQRINTDLVVVNINNLPESEKSKFLQIKKQNIIIRIILDMKYEGIELSAPVIKQIDEVIVRTLNRDYQLTEEDRKRLLEKIDNYFRSARADIQLTTDRTINKIGKIIISQPKVTQEDIINILNENVPYEIIAQDPEAIDYAAKSLYTIVKDMKQEARVDMLFMDIAKIITTEFSIQAEEYKDLRENIKGNIWAINDDEFSVNYEKYKELTGRVPDEEQRIKVEFRLTGMPVVLKNLDEQLIRSQYQSLGFALLMVLVLLMVQLRSFVGGVISIIPITLTIIINFGLMSFLNIPLDNATMMIASVAIGIGIDYTIHFLAKFKIELKRSKNEMVALSKTIETVGKAILINTLTVALGFMVLIFSNIVPLQRFGWLIAVTMVISMFGAVAVLPSLVLLIKPKFLRNIR